MNMLEAGYTSPVAGRPQKRSPTKPQPRSRLAIMGGMLLLLIFLLAGHAVYDSESPVRHHAVRFLSLVTSRTAITDHHLGSRAYAVIMDAGSTGTRLLVFTFDKSPTDGSLKLVDEFFKEVKPGVSSYADNPAQAAEVIRGLFDDAKQLIPQEHWAKTSASLKATAGLRLLPGGKSENIINQIREEFDASGFLVKSSSVSIIDGSSEGLFLWTTINFLLDKLTGNLNDTVAVIDMGGGSNQLAMFPADQETINNAPPEDVLYLQLLGQPARFYVRSYLGLGLMTMRLTVLRGSNQTVDPFSHNFLSPFIEPGLTTVWEFQGEKYKIRGISARSNDESSEESDEDVVQRFTKLRALVLRFIKERGVHRIAELQKRGVYTVSYFYDRAVEAGLISMEQGGALRVQDYCRAARKACESPVSQKPFACIDLTYLCVLLEDGYGLPYQHVVNLKKKIDGHETSWALGAALFELDRDARDAKEA